MSRSDPRWPLALLLVALIALITPLHSEASNGNHGYGYDINYYITDHLNNVRMVIEEPDINGDIRVLEAYDYLPYGEPIELTVSSLSPDTYARHLFLAKELDSESNLYHLEARKLSVGLSQFTSPDPLSLRPPPGGFLARPHLFASAYAYGGGNPMTYKDASGQIILDWQETKRNWATVMTWAKLGSEKSGLGFGTAFVSALALTGSVANDALMATGVYGVGKELGRQGLKQAAKNIIADEAGSLMVGGGGPAAAGAAGEGAGGLVSRIGEDARLVTQAEKLSGSLQREADSLVQQLGKGNMNPGIGTKRVFGDVFEARARGGARVYFRQGEEGIEIVGKSTKANQGKVIKILEQIYGE